MKLFSCAVETNNVPVIVSWIMYILRRIEHLHYSCNRPVPQIEEIPNSYDSTKGVAYFFTESGNQLRQMPGYEESGNKNYDDPPEVDPHCTKNYPGVSYGRVWLSLPVVLPYTWTFVWFPSHSRR